MRTHLVSSDSKLWKESNIPEVIYWSLKSLKLRPSNKYIFVVSLFYKNIIKKNLVAFSTKIKKTRIHLFQNLFHLIDSLFFEIRWFFFILTKKLKLFDFMFYKPLIKSFGRK